MMRALHRKHTSARFPARSASKKSLSSRLTIQVKRFSQLLPPGGRKFSASAELAKHGDWELRAKFKILREQNIFLFFRNFFF